MTEKELKDRTKIFAHRCVKIATEFENNQLGYHIRGQLIRCSTSVAANYRATCIAQSEKSFIAKVSIVIEEVDESNFWLDFVKVEGISNSKELDFLIKESSELTAIFIASRKTLQNRINKK